MVRVDDADRVHVFERLFGEVVADHPVFAPGEVSILDEHYGGPRPGRPTRAPRPKTATDKRFLALGEVAEQFVLGAAAAGVPKLPTELEQILVLLDAHGEPALLAALGRALEFKRSRADDIRLNIALPGQGDLQGLIRYLAGNGVEPSRIQDLRDAGAADLVDDNAEGHPGR